MKGPLFCLENLPEAETSFFNFCQTVPGAGGLPVRFITTSGTGVAPEEMPKDLPESPSDVTVTGACVQGHPGRLA